MALFGKKDYQQLMVIRNMVADLNLPIEIVGGETVRAADGLALSSRNGYLSAAERAEAPRLYRTLTKVVEADPRRKPRFRRPRAAGHGRIGRCMAGFRTILQCAKRFDLQLPAAHDSGLVVLAAARLGSTRLIDNLEV